MKPDPSTSLIPSQHEFEARVLAVIRRIPPGRVATYGQIAALAGRPRNARQVGRILGGLPPDDDAPWHRVVNAQGRISDRAEPHGTEALQRDLLEAEGVGFSRAGRIRMVEHQWDPPPTIIASGESKSGRGAPRARRGMAISRPQARRGGKP